MPAGLRSMRGESDSRSGRTPTDLWGKQYPQAVYHLVTSTPERVEAIGGDELLYADGKRRSGAYAAIRTRRRIEFAFAVVGSMTDPKQADGAGGKIRQAGR